MSSQRSTWIQHSGRYLGALLIAGVLGYLLVNHPVGDELLRKSYDTLYAKWFYTPKPPDNFVIVYIDDKSHDALDQPYDAIWDRALHGRLLDRMTEDGARIVFFDIVFNQRSSRENSDVAFSEAIKRNRRVVLAASAEFNISPEGYKEVKVVAPHALFRRTAKSWGMVNYPLDPDQGVRMLSLAKDDDVPVPSAMWRTALIINPDVEKRLGARVMDRWLNYVAPPDDVLWVSYASALTDGDLKAGFFRDKTVFVGLKGSVGFTGASKDTFRSPFEDPDLRSKAFFNGVELHASALSNLLNQNWFRRIDRTTESIIVILFGFLLVIILVPMAPVYSFFAAAAIALAAGVIALKLSWYTHTFSNWLVPVAIQTPGVFIWSIGCHYYAEARRRQRLRRSFSAYLSPVMVKRLADRDEEPQLGGHEEEITAFFSDIESFSSFSEILTPSQLTELMNEYLTAMTDILHDERGTLDKYIGDAIVAMFGAPIELEDHALRACATAHRIQMQQKELRRKWAREGDKWPERVSHMRTRIGLNTGIATVGNLGSRSRFNYTMMGDTVNLAARCESGAKAFGIYTLVTEATVEAAEAHESDFVFRFLDKIVVKGRTRPVSVYELAGSPDTIDSKFSDCLDLYRQATERYLDQDWHRAIALLEKSAPLEETFVDGGLAAGTSPSQVLLERCRALKENPPGDGWDGVFVMTGK